MEINLNNSNNKKTLVNINTLFNRRNNAIKFGDDYGSMILEAKRKELNHQKQKLDTKIFIRIGWRFINETKNDDKNINEQIFKDLKNILIFFIIIHYF